MVRLIDADALAYRVADEWKQNLYTDAEMVDIQLLLRHAPTIEAVPVEFVMDQYNSEFVCDNLNDDDDWCAEHCQFSEAQPMCIYRFIERVWIPEMERRAKMDEVSE